MGYSVKTKISQKTAMIPAPQIPVMEGGFSALQIQENIPGVVTMVGIVAVAAINLRSAFKGVTP